MSPAARRDVKLVLAVGQHDPDYVDAYYGPAAWKAEAEAAKRPLADLHAEADGLRRERAGAAPAASGPDADLLALRHRYLDRQLAALASRVDLLSGRKMTFDEE